MTLIVLCLFPWIGFAQTENIPDQALSRFDAYEFGQAIRLTELALSHDSTLTDMLVLQARAHQALYQYPNALAALRRALRMNDTNPSVLNHLVNLYRITGETDSALQVALRLSSQAPENRYYTLQLAGLYYDDKRFNQSMEIYRKLYAADSTSAYLARQLGNCCYELQLNDSAIRYFRRTLRLAPHDRGATGKLVNAFLRNNEVAMALYWTQRFLKEVDSAYLPVLRQSGYCYYLLMDYKTTAETFTKCRSLGDTSLFTMRYLGLAWYKQEQYDSAAPCFLSAFKQDTANPEICFYYGVSALRSGLADSGLAYLNRTYRLLMPSDQFLFLLLSELADAYNTAGEHDTALVLLIRASETNAGNPTILFKIAYQLDFHLRRPYEALPWYRRFADQNRSRPPQSNDDTEILQRSFEDYASDRIREIGGKKGRK